MSTEQQQQQLDLLQAGRLTDAVVSGAMTGRRQELSGVTPRPAVLPDGEHEEEVASVWA